MTAVWFTYVYDCHEHKQIILADDTSREMEAQTQTISLSTSTKFHACKQMPSEGDKETPLNC
ncbi:hypothetical protein DPMN_094552 [Dreissena polymorpha]|uniref:Uncharacterized protein n=1 Tax=Dreissena polymorpha TaxID=45954 RepID=A0A9D4L7L9_DREPO|nr:hypothetical protein DPMN_094552 [Dreissena polymorpha]